MMEKILDCRSATCYLQAHLAGAVNIPADELFLRMHELPKRNLPISLCGDSVSLAVASRFLIGRGYEIAEQIIWNDSCGSGAAIETGPSSARLWQPAPLIERFIVSDYAEPGRGIDIACGAGRDMIALALAGWQMTGVDHHQDALRRSLDLAARHHVSVELRCMNIDAINNVSSISASLNKGVWDLVTVCRFLHRPFFPVLVDLLAPGGIVIFQAFMQGCELIGNPRNADHILKPGELAAVFDGFEILLDEVEYLEDGRPLSAFIARKPR